MGWQIFGDPDRGRTDGRWTNKGAERFVGRALCVMVKSEIFAHCTAKGERKEEEEGRECFSRQFEGVVTTPARRNSMKNLQGTEQNPLLKKMMRNHQLCTLVKSISCLNLFTKYCPCFCPRHRTVTTEEGGRKTWSGRTRTEIGRKD